VAKQHTTWSRHLASIPAERTAPASEWEVAELLARATLARRRVKVVGAGHSFSDIGFTDGMLMTLDRMRGVVRVDAAAHLVTVQAASGSSNSWKRSRGRDWGSPSSAQLPTRAWPARSPQGRTVPACATEIWPVSSAACGWSPGAERSSRWMKRTSACRRPGSAWERSA